MFEHMLVIAEGMEKVREPKHLSPFLEEWYEQVEGTLVANLKTGAYGTLLSYLEEGELDVECFQSLHPHCEVNVFGDLIYVFVPWTYEVNTVRGLRQEFLKMKKQTSEIERLRNRVERWKIEQNIPPGLEVRPSVQDEKKGVYLGIGWNYEGGEIQEDTWREIQNAENIIRTHPLLKGYTQVRMKETLYKTEVFLPASLSNEVWTEVTLVMIKLLGGAVEITPWDAKTDIEAHTSYRLITWNSKLVDGSKLSPFLKEWEENMIEAAAANFDVPNAGDGMVVKKNSGAVGMLMARIVDGDKDDRLARMCSDMFKNKVGIDTWRKELPTGHKLVGIFIPFSYKGDPNEEFASWGMVWNGERVEM